MKLRFMLKSLAVVAGALAASPALAATTQKAAPALTPVTVYAQTYGSWVYRCTDAAADNGQHAVCQVAQEMGIKRNGHIIPIALIAFSKPAGQTHYNMSAVVPLGILLPAGIRIAVDQSAAVERNVDFCKQDACVVLPQPADGLTRSFREGKTGHLTFRFIDGHPFTVNFSLEGFSDAMKAFDSGKLPPVVKG